MKFAAGILAALAAVSVALVAFLVWCCLALNKDPYG